MTIDLDVLEGLAKAGTAVGEWRKCGGATPKYCAITSPSGYIVFGMADAVSDREGNGNRINAPGMEAQQANAALIVAAVNALPDLIAAARERDALREVMPDLTAVIAWLQNGCDPVHAVTELAILKGRIERARQALKQETQS